MKQKRKIILTIIISLVFCLAIAGGIIFLALKNKPATPPNQEPPPPEILTPTLTVPSSVSVDLLDSLTFTPTVQNLGSYTLSITIENTSIAIISNNIITPKSIGTTKIISKINTSPAIVKETTLKVLDCTKQVDFYITDQNNQPVEKYYTNTSYILEVRQNILPSSFPQFYY